MTAEPYWVKIERVRTLVNAYTSPDGSVWTLGSDTIPMGATIFIGLGVSSHTATSTATAKFDNVTGTI